MLRVPGRGGKDCGRASRAIDPGACSQLGQIAGLLRDPDPVAAAGLGGGLVAADQRVADVASAVRGAGRCRAPVALAPHAPHPGSLPLRSVMPPGEPGSGFLLPVRGGHRRLRCQAGTPGRMCHSRVGVLEQ